MFGDGRDGSPPCVAGLGHAVCKRREYPALPGAGFVEVRCSHCPFGHHPQHVPIDVRSDGLEQVECKRIAVVPVDMEYAEAGVEAECVAGHAALGLCDRTGGDSVCSGTLAPTSLVIG